MPIVDRLLFGFTAAITTILGAKMAVLGGKTLRLFLLKKLDEILEKILNSVIGAGLVCGFMTTRAAGLECYLVVVPIFSFLIKDNRRRIGAMAGFVTGQLVMFASVYNGPLYEGLVQPHRIMMLFLAFFLVQLLWTSLTTLRNWPLLDPKDQRKRVVSKRKRVVRRLVRLQLEFMLTFILQLKFLYIEPNSMIHRLVNSYIKAEAKKLLFVRSSFAGWLIGHIRKFFFFVKLLEFIVIEIRRVRKNFFQS